MADFWSFLNSNIVILFLGSAVGFAFVHLVWEPYKQRELTNTTKSSVRNEVKYRLKQLEYKLPDHNILGEVDGGSHASYLDPSYQNWGLAGLIYVGWGEEALDVCYPYFPVFGDTVDRVRNLKTQAEAQAALTKITETLEAGGRVKKVGRHK